MVVGPQRGEKGRLIVPRSSAPLSPDHGRSEPQVGDTPEKKGVITKLFGVILIFVGSLDLMLFWRGGLATGSLYFAFIAAGAFLYVVGSIRQIRRA